MRAFSIIAAFVLLLAARAAGQDAVEIKIAYAGTGDRAKVTVEERSETALVLTAGGKETNTTTVKTKSLVYVDEVIDNPRGAKLPDKLKRTYKRPSSAPTGRTPPSRSKARRCSSRRRGRSTRSR